MKLNIIISLSIAIIYFALINKVFSVYYNIEKINDMCKNIKFNYSSNDNDIYNQCDKEKRELLDNIKKQQLVPYIIIICVSLLFSIVLNNYNNILSYGIGLGTLFILINLIISNWYNFNDKHKLLVYSSAFISLILLSLYFLKK